MYIPFFDKKFGCGTAPPMFGQCPKFGSFFLWLPLVIVSYSVAVSSGSSVFAFLDPSTVKELVDLVVSVVG